MTKSLQLKYGERVIEAQLPLGVQVRTLTPRTAPREALEVAAQPRAALEEALSHPIGTPPIEDIVHPGESCAIVVSDVTRLWVGTREFLPVLVERLTRAGIADRDIQVVVARGTHRMDTPEEIAQIVGPELVKRLDVVQHDPDGPVRFLGTTSRGTDVAINEAAASHDRLILTGGIVHHAMAGYGGGRKSVLPGISSRKTVGSNHLWVLDPDKPSIRSGVGSAMTAGNPIHEDMMEAAALAQPDFILNAVTDASGRFAGFFAGDFREAWRAGCDLVDELYSVPLDARADVVLASCGGFPRDISIYQASKAFYNAWMAVKPGGTIVLSCEARDGGGGDEFFKWFEYPDIESCHRALLADFTIAGYMAFLVYLIAVRNRVFLITDLPSDQVELMHMTPVRPGEVSGALGWLSPSDDVLVMPEAAITLPRRQ